MSSKKGAKVRTSGKRNRNAGHSWERELAQEFLPFYPMVATSRAVNRNRDAQKVDLAYADEFKHGRFPYNVQAKSYSKTLLYPKLLSELPQEQGYKIMNVLLHKQTQRSGERFMTRAKFAIMAAEDFFKLVAYRRAFEEVQNYLDYIPEKERKELEKTLATFKI